MRTCFRHGIRREVFICLLAANAEKLLRTGKGSPDLTSLLDVGEVAQMALDRWILPRSRQRSEYQRWTSDDLVQLFGDHSRIIQAGNSEAGYGADVETQR